MKLPMIGQLLQKHSNISNFFAIVQQFDQIFLKMSAAAAAAPELQFIPSHFLTF
jgi:hypothetical protein